MTYNPAWARLADVMNSILRDRCALEIIPDNCSLSQYSEEERDQLYAIFKGWA